MAPLMEEERNCPQSVDPGRHTGHTCDQRWRLSELKREFPVVDYSQVRPSAPTLRLCLRLWPWLCLCLRFQLQL